MLLPSAGGELTTKSTMSTKKTEFFFFVVFVFLVVYGFLDSRRVGNLGRRLKVRTGSARPEPAPLAPGNAIRRTEEVA